MIKQNSSEGVALNHSKMKDNDAESHCVEKKDEVNARPSSSERKEAAEEIVDRRVLKTIALYVTFATMVRNLYFIIGAY